MVVNYCCPDQVWAKATPSTNQGWGVNPCATFDLDSRNNVGDTMLGVLCCRDPAITGP
jgi:hypothetical protein